MPPEFDVALLLAGPMPQTISLDVSIAGQHRWGRSAGRLYVTCLSTYMLEVYYRHLPLYKTEASPSDSKRDRNGSDRTGWPSAAIHRYGLSQCSEPALDDHGLTPLPALRSLHARNLYDTPIRIDEPGMLRLWEVNLA